MNSRYLFGSLLVIPLLPLLAYQGKQVRKRVPSLPEATGPAGAAGQEFSDKGALNIITLGESTIAGVGVKTHKEGFSGTFTQSLAEQLQRPVNWRVYARGGYTAKRVRHKLVPKIEERALDLIVVGLGGNDAFTLNSPGKWIADISGLIDDLQAKYPGTPIVFTNMPPIKEFPAFTPAIKFVIGNLVEILGEELDNKVSTLSNVYYLNEKLTLAQWARRLGIDPNAENFFSDGVHPSLFTYQIWAREVAAFVHQNVLAKAD